VVLAISGIHLYVWRRLVEASALRRR